jgi:hypothetical protein
MAKVEKALSKKEVCQGQQEEAIRLRLEKLSSALCWNLVVGFSPWPNTNFEILMAHSCLARGGTKV